jgi:histidine triad (HIT) family protein
MSLTTPYDPNNLFARLLRGEIPCVKVYEDDHALAFMDIFPQAPGHTLVIPKTPSCNLLDIPVAALGPYMHSVQRVAQGVRDAFNAEGLTVFQFNGAAGGQTVFHLHFHIIPRDGSSGLKGHGQSSRADDEELKSHARAIAAAIASAA